MWTMNKAIKRSVLKKVLRRKLKEDKAWARHIIDLAAPCTYNIVQYMRVCKSNHFERVWRTVFRYITQIDAHELALLKAEALQSGLLKGKDVNRARAEAVSSII